MTVLTKMLELYRQILEVSKRKREILIKADIKELEKVTRELEILIFQAGKLEALRENAIGELTKQYGLAREEATLSQIKEKADGETAQKITQLEQNFRQLISELMPLNQLNEKLIERALHYVNFNINILTNSTAGPTYTVAGPNSQKEQPQTNSRNLFDRKV